MIGVESWVRPTVATVYIPTALGRSRVTQARLTELYRQYAPLVHARARRIVGDDADDIVQDVFIRLLKSPPAEEGVSTFIYRISTNLCIDRLRHRARRDDRWQEEVRATVVGKETSLETALADRQLCRRLMARADPKTQEAVILVYFDEMTQVDAANLLGVNRKTIAARINRFQEEAKKTLSRWTT